MEVLFHLRYPKRDKDKGTVYCRCTVDSVRGPERSLNLRIFKNDWNKGKQSVNPNSEAAQLQNARITQIRQDFDRAYLELKTLGNTITARKLVECVFGVQKSMFTLKGLFDAYRNEKQATTLNCKETYRNYGKYETILDRELNSLLIADITDDDFIRLLTTLKSKYSNDYAVKTAQYLRTILDYAIDKKLIQNNPTKRFKLERKEDYDTTHLSREELAKLIAFDFGNKRLLIEERDSFVFCCFTGLHHSDYIERTFEITEYKGRKWLYGFRKKSVGGKKDKPYQMPLHPAALAVIEKYGGVDKLPVRNNAKRNLLLKTITAYLAFEIELTTKIARKTFADYCLNTLSLRLETLAELLGHTSLNYVKHYAKITNVSIDREMVFEG